MIVRVPASSANLGPGFDCFGIAWQCFNLLEFSADTDSLSISGCPEQYQNKDNLAYQGYLAALKAAGLPEEPVSIKFLDCDIPVSRGMGSSAALIAGGVMAANRLKGLNLSSQQLLAVATEVEGHPDNVAPALFGGLSVSTMDGCEAVTASFPVSEKLHFTALVPDFELSTELSRSVLPGSYSRADAIFNVSRAALLLKVLQDGDCKLLKTALQDRIHQPFRTKLIDGFERVQQIAEDCGVSGMCISGAGSTLLCIAESPLFSDKMASAMAAEFPAWQVLPLLPDLEGAQIIQK